MLDQDMEVKGQHFPTNKQVKDKQDLVYWTYSEQVKRFFFTASRMNISFVPEPSLVATVLIALHYNKLFLSRT